MAAVVGDLAVRVGANTADFEQGMAKAARSVKNFSSKAATQLRSVANNAAKMGAAATVAGAAITAALYSKQSKVIDSLAKTADALNVTTEALQAMNHLAELNGVSSEAMSKGLRRMEVNLGMAARSGGAAADALADVGINIEDILKLKPDQQLQALASAISNVENQSLKASIATDLFGRDGVAMLKVLNQVQKDGIQPTIDMLNEYGIAISRVDAAQVEAANDSFLEAQKIIEGLANTLTVELAPYVQAVADHFKDAARQSGGFGDEFQSAIGGAITVGAKFADVLHGIRVVFKGVELAVAASGAVITSYFQGAMELVAKFVDFGIGEVNRVITAFNKLPGVSNDLVDTVSDSAFMDGIRGIGDAARENFTRVKDEMHAMAMQELPSSAAENFITKIKEDAILAAEEVAAASALINEGKGSEGASDEEKYARKEQALRDHLSTMYGIQAASSEGIEGLLGDQWGVATSSTAGAMKSIVSTMGGGSKKAFEISKKWAIADAIISTAQGIAAGVRLGWPMAIPAVAYAAANGMKQISQIKSQSFGGGGSAPSGAGTAAASAPAASSGSASGSPSQASTLTVAPIDPNAIFSGGAMQQFGEQLYDFSKDGGKVVFAA